MDRTIITHNVWYKIQAIAWPNLESLDLSGLRLVSLVPPEICLVLRGLTWFHVASLNLTWTHLVAPGLARTHFVSLGLICSDLDPLGFATSEYRNEGFLNRIFGPWARWARGLSR